MKEAGSGKPSRVCLDDNLSTYLFQLYQILAAFCGIYFFVDTGSKLKHPNYPRTAEKG